MRTKNSLRKEWDGLVSGEYGTAKTWFKASRLLPFFYDKEHDQARATQLLRWLVRHKYEVTLWIQSYDNFSAVLIRLMTLLTKSVGSVKFASE